MSNLVNEKLPAVLKWPTASLLEESKSLNSRLRGVHMESVPAENQHIAKSQLHAVNMLLAVSTTLVVGLEVGRHWGSYGLFNKFIGVILILNLLGSLLKFVGKKEKMTVEWFVTSAYICLMLATILFGH